MTASDKHALRRQLRARYSGKEERDRQSVLLCRHVLESREYKSAGVVGGYMPMLHEADVTEILIDALAVGKKLVLPLCDAPPRMTLRLVSSMEELVSGAYGILEPRSDAAVVPVDEVDLLLVPLEGIDDAGFRLGKGGGYYDCLLANGQVNTIGCALSWQQVRELPHMQWDIPLSACADQQGIHYFGK